MRQNSIIKVLFLGEEAAGKGELREKNWLGLQPKWTNQMGSDFTLKQINVQGRLNTYQLTLQLWDVASHDRFEAIRDIYYHGSDAAIVIFDVTKTETFLKIADWIKEFWIYNGKGQRPVVLVGNRIQFRKTKDLLPKSAKLEYTKTKFETNHKDKTTNKKLELYIPSWKKEPQYIPTSWASEYSSKITETSGFDTPYIELDTNEIDISNLDELVYILGSLCLPFVVPEEKRTVGIPAPKGDLFSKTKVRKIILDAGAIRVSKGAIAALNFVLEKQGLSIANHAIEISRVAKRKTVMGKDIDRAKRG
ncbi:MAG: histone [Candidatus Hodarchaeales archaeon]|jgi:small GTP-binding protein